jgi:hypothetical protein
VLACWLRAAPTSAQEATAPKATEAPTSPTQGPDASERPSERITVPEPLNTPVQPVEDSDRRVELVLELVVDQAGHVVYARPLNGPEPYATLATEATKAWSFRPATKGGQPVAARVSFLVTFEPEQRSPAAPTAVQVQADEAPEPPPRTTAAHVSAVPVSEVLILGELHDPGGIGWTRLETQKLAGAFDDPLRVLEIMPGVTTAVNGLPIFFVRGAPPGNVGFYMDGIRIPQLYHAFVLTSVVHPAFISKVDLHAGPMPARFGRHAGAAIDARMAEPHGEFRAEASLDLIDAGAFVEAPILGKRGYVLVGGHYSFTGLLASSIAPDLKLDFWDYQAMAGYRLGTQDEMRLFAFGSYDFVASGPFPGGTQFHRVDLSWMHDFGPKARVQVSATGGWDATHSSFGVLSDTNFQTRVRYTLTEKQAILRAGADVGIDDYTTEIDPTITEPETYLNLYPTRTDMAGGAFFDVVLFPDGFVRVIPGVRGDVYSSLGEVMAAADVRLAAEYDILPWLSAEHAFGTAHQGPSFIPNIPGVQVGGLRGALQESLQAATSFRFSLPWHVGWRVGAYANVTTDLVDPISETQTFSVDETSADRRSLGRSVGFWTMINRPLTRRLGGIITYTYSTMLRSHDEIATIGGFDRPHTLNAALTYDLGRHWQASAKLVVASGIPGRRTTLDGYVYDGSRADPTIRLDAKLAKHWYVTDHFNWGIYAEVLNATYTGSVTRRTCGRRGCEDEGTAPIFFPTIGIDAAWN